MELADDEMPVGTWREAFALLTSLELGVASTWLGPDSFEELKLRVETLALLLSFIPRSELARLGEIVAHLAAVYRSGILPDLVALRVELRHRLAGPVPPPLSQSPYLRRAAAIIARDPIGPGPQIEASIALSGDQKGDADLCQLGMAAWLAQLDEDPKWSKVRLLAYGEEEASIDEVFVDVFAVPDTDLEVDADGGTERISRVAGRITGETHAVINAPTMVARTSRLCVVVGDPGSGKTTLIRWIARKVVVEEGAPDKISDFDTALVVELGPFALALAKSPDLTLLDHFFANVDLRRLPNESIIALPNWPRAASSMRNASLKGPRYLLLLDGWDEVPSGLQDAVRRCIDRERPFFTIIITSRPSGFPRRLATGGRAEVYHIAGLTREGRKTLADRYLRAAGRGTLVPDLLRQVEDNRDLRELASNPFMLALLTRAVAPGVMLMTEWTLAEIYRLAVGWIVDAFADGSPSRRYPLSRSLDGLGRLSYELLFHEVLPRYVFSMDDLTGKLEHDEAEAVLASRFVSQAGPPGTWFAFLHATFEEYFAARHAASLRGRELAEFLDRAFLSATRWIVLEFIIGLAQDAGEMCRARLDQWMRQRDRYSQVVYQVARLLTACPATRRPAGLVTAVLTELWSSINGTRELDVKERGVRLFARLDPVALCRSVRAQSEPDQFVLDCITSAVPPEVGISERVADLMNPAMRERVEAELWGGRSPAEVASNRRILTEPAAETDKLREAILFAGAARDVEAVPPLVALLRSSRLSEELQREISTSLGLIGGTEAVQALVELVTGDIPVSTVAAGLARRSLQHIGGGHQRLDPVGRDTLLKRIACARIEQPRLILMLSALQGFPVRTGTRFLKHLAISASTPNFVRVQCLEILQSSLSDADLDDLLRRIESEGSEIQAMLLATAIQRRRPIPISWLSRRLRTSAHLPDKTMLLTVALAMSGQQGQNSAELDRLLMETAGAALTISDIRHADLAGAFRSALKDMPVNHASQPLWLDTDACRRVLQAFVDCNEDISSEQVMLAAMLMCRSPTRESGELLVRTLHSCRDRLNPPPAEMQVKLLDEVARNVAAALADLDPQSLLLYPADWPPIDEVLHTLSNRRGWFVFDDRILDREGRRLRAPWQGQEFEGDTLWRAGELGHDLTSMTHATRSDPTPVITAQFPTASQHGTDSAASRPANAMSDAGRPDPSRTKRRPSPRNALLPAQAGVASLADKVDIGILTIRPDEFKAVLDRLPNHQPIPGKRYYNYARVQTKRGTELGVAVVRLPNQGQLPAHIVTNDIIADLNPPWLFLGTAKK